MSLNSRIESNKEQPPAPLSLLPLPPLLLRFGFRVQGFGFPVSGFGCRISGFGFRVSGFGFRVSSAAFRVLGFMFRVSGFGFRVSCFGFRVSGFVFHVSGLMTCWNGGEAAGAAPKGLLKGDACLRGLELVDLMNPPTQGQINSVSLQIPRRKQTESVCFLPGI